MTEGTERMEFMDRADALIARVAEMKAQGVPSERRAALTHDERQAVGEARCAAFQAGTQGRGKPSAYGTGKPPEKDEKRKGR